MRTPRWIKNLQADAAIITAEAIARTFTDTAAHYASDLSTQYNEGVMAIYQAAADRATLIGQELAEILKGDE